MFEDEAQPASRSAKDDFGLTPADVTARRPLAESGVRDLEGASPYLRSNPPAGALDIDLGDPFFSQRRVAGVWGQLQKEGEAQRQAQADDAADAHRQRHVRAFLRFGQAQGRAQGAEQAQAPLDEAGVVPERRPSIAFSNEANMVEPWMPRSRNPQRVGQARSNKVLGKYWRTFGERSKAIGGGVGGFFGSLFGFGMKRANALAGARARRAQERGTANMPLPTAMRAQLSNQGQARASGKLNYPQEPGIAYDDMRAIRTRVAFSDAFSVFSSLDKPSESDAKRLKNVHGAYDLSTGSRSQPLGADLLFSTEDKFTALVRANQEAGESAATEEASPHEPKARLRNPDGVEKRVRFMDGANDEARPTQGDFDAKPRPSRVQMHPVPMLKHRSWKDRLRLRISDDEALSNERSLWQIENRLNRMDPDRAEVHGMNEGVRGDQLAAANPAAGSDDDQAMREALFTSQIARDLATKRRDGQEAAFRRNANAFPLEPLGKGNQYQILQDLKASGGRFKDLDENRELKEQLGELLPEEVQAGVPQRYFRNKYWDAFDARMELMKPRADPVGDEASNAGDDGGQIEEEEQP